jgi:hypothetical protein
MLLSRHQNTGSNHEIKIGKRSFKNVAQFKCLGTTVKNQNFMKEKIKRRLNSGSACYNSIQNLFSSHLVPKNFKTGIYKTVIFSVVVYEFKTWSLTLREEHRLRVFENKVLRRIFGSRREEMMGGWRKPQNEELHNLYSSPSIIRMVKSRRMRWQGMWHRWRM